MQITVKILNGQEHAIEVQAEQKISDVKQLLAKKLDIPVNQQRMMNKGKALVDQNKLSDYSIVEGTKLMLVIKKDEAVAPVVAAKNDESNLTRELKAIGKAYVTDVDQFAAVFNQELKKLISEMSLDDIERYDDYQAKVMSANQNMSVS